MRSKRYIVLLVLPVLACTMVGTPVPSSPTPEPDLQTVSPPTVIPISPTPTPISPTEPAPNASKFPDPNNYRWQLIVAGLVRPVDLQPDGSDRLFVIEKAGRIRIIENGGLIETPFLNIEDRVNDSSNEMGLLGLAFHPIYAQSGYFFVNYTGNGGDTIISRFRVSRDSNIADPASEIILLRLNQPFRNHNGGTLQFGPDGYLYAGLGDGGSAGDPFGNGQKMDTLLGKVLRMDVDSADPYAVPADNPFGNEIWDYGLRNPWRISFDRLTGDLYIGDVGQGTWEEIDIHPANASGGINFGWNYREGAHNYSGTAPAGLTDPVAEYSHTEGGCSVTGGYVYRGFMSEWNGIYLYGDYCTGYVWGLVKFGEDWQTQLLFETGERITSFGQDEGGELFLVSDGGRIYKLVRK